MQEEQPGNQPPQAGWQYNAVGAPSPTYAPAHSDDYVAWSASEFITHEKDPAWYAMLGVAAAAMVLLAYILTKDKITVVMILVVMIFFAIFSARKPRTLSYQVDSSGIHVGNKSYGYELFKSFSVIQEGGIRSITLMPMKRLMPSLSIYMDPANEQRIVNMLTAYLPSEEGSQDVVERLMRRLRF